MTREAAPQREGCLLGDRYRLLERIDAGGAGEVWRARDERLEREVAVKLLGASADEAFRSRFTDEARRAATISHPNVVTVFDEGQDGPDAYMVMEFVRGRTLRDLAAERGALQPLEAARIVAQIADALDAAHAAGVIHCDVKPANVILDERGTAKLTDFGVARAARGPAEHELIATPRYIAPERIEGKVPTPASDVYGLGLVAFELIAGHPPFQGVDTDDLLRERLEGPPPSLRRERPGIAPEIDVVVAKALARDPARRYQTAGAFARDLLSAVRGERTVTMPVIPPAARTLRRSGARFGTGNALALLAIVAILAGVALLFLDFPRAGIPGLGPAASPTAAVPTTPNVVGMEVADAVQELVRSGYQPVSWNFTSAPSAPACSVVSQSPAAGTALQKGTAASVVYAASSGCRLPK
ncbi:MAG: serine/threonine protein kinase [Chloroflexota bacterium]|nr:serine/threonine protein kinase [Chloroflexota bacterium]